MSIFWFFVSFFAAAAVVCTLITPRVRSLALRFGLVDEPDGRRKIHARPIPVAGGVAVLITSFLVLTSLFVFAEPLESIFKDDVARDRFDKVVTFRWQLIGLAVAAVIIGLVGIADDMWGLRGRHKLLGQVVAVAVVIYSGVIVEKFTVFERSFELGGWAVPLTAFWLLGAINSLNLIDGVDGMLGSLGCIICASFAAMAFLNQQYQAAFIATALAGSLLGFLFFNFPPATIFLGDCGSMLVGLAIGVLGIECSLKGAATVTLAAPAALLVIPIFDTSAAIVRRKLTGRSIFTTDRGHLHHRLLARGYSNRLVLLMVGSLCLIASIGALGSVWLQNQFIAIVSVIVVVTILVVTRLFGHAEFLLLKERMLGFFAALRNRDRAGHVRQSAVRLQGSAAWEELWRNVIAVAEQLQLKTVCLDVNAPALHEGYHARWGRLDSDIETPCYWRTEIPLATNGQVVGRLEVVGRRDADSLGDKIAVVGKLVEELEAAIVVLTAPATPPTLNSGTPTKGVGLETAQPA